MASEVSSSYLAKLIADLPEIYQPVYAHPELSHTVSRSCVDRLANITSVYDALQTLLDRPLRVLDLGCAQGFFSLALAERGASVYGIDFLDKNIEVCNALAAENPNVQVTFEVDHIQAVLQRLEPDQYDLVLGLSVFHHIVHEHGVSIVRDLLDHAAQCVGVLITEIALREEPLYWATSQPEDSRVLLEGFAFVHEMARHETHLSLIDRPLYVASNRYWVLDRHAGIFETWTTEPHALAQGYHQGTRRYYFSANHVVKMFQLDNPLGERNREEILRESAFLANPPCGFRIPACLISGLHETEAWLVLDRIPGKLLLDIIHEGQFIEPLSILHDVIQQLASLETVGLYHDDVRTWNILIEPDGKSWLIDYGSISTKAHNFGWPDNIYLAFFIFVHEVATCVVENPDPLRTVSISPYNLPQPYRAWAMALWKRPLKEWSFKLMLDLLEALPQFDQREEFEEPNELWAKAMEKAVQAQKQFGQHLKLKLEAVENQQKNLLQPFMNSHARLTESMEKQITWLQQQFVLGQESLKRAESHAQEQEQRAVAAEAHAQEQEQRAVTAEALAQEQERRAVAAETHAQEQEQRTVAAEAHAQEQEQRTVAAEAHAQEQEQRAVTAEVLAQNQERRAVTSEAQRQEQQARIDELGGNAHHWWLQARALETERNALRQSWSWRITVPVRWMGGLITYSVNTLRLGTNKLVRVTINIFRYPLTGLMRIVLNKPALSERLNRILLRYPPLHQQLLGIARQGGVIPDAPRYQIPLVQNTESWQQATPSELSQLTSRACWIYRNLKVAIDDRRKDNG